MNPSIMKNLQGHSVDSLTSALRTGVRTSTARQWGWLFEEPPKLPYRAMNYRSSPEEPKRAPAPAPARGSFRGLTA